MPGCALAEHPAREYGWRDKRVFQGSERCTMYRGHPTFGINTLFSSENEDNTTPYLHPFGTQTNILAHGARDFNLIY